MPALTPRGCDPRLPSRSFRDSPMTDRAAPSDQALASAPDRALKPTACIALADGQIFWGRGFGAAGVAVGELCFNTAMTGYQEIMTDPSYAGQIVTFTFPHIGNVGVNAEDDETQDPFAAGMVVKWDPTEPSSWRAAGELVDVAGAARPDRRRRRRHPAADAGDPAAGRAARRDQPRAGRRLRPRRPAGAGARLPRARGHGPRQGRHLRPELPLGRDALGLARRLPARARAPGGASSRSTTAPSATSCAASRPPAAT